MKTITFKANEEIINAIEIIKKDIKNNMNVELNTSDTIKMALLVYAESLTK